MKLMPYSKLSKLDYRNPEMCAKCRGKCCISLPGISWPQQFGAPRIGVMRAKIADALKSGKWSVDCWDDFDEQGYGLYIRPATVNAEGMFDRSWGGTCVFLSASGCELPYEERPLGCKLLVPISGDCDYKDIPGNGKQAAATAWAKYRPLIRQILKKLGEE